MSISLAIPEPTKLSKRTFTLDDEVWQRLELYVQAAQVTQPAATMDSVLRAILAQQFEKDRTFKQWERGQLKGSGG